MFSEAPWWIVEAVDKKRAHGAPPSTATRVARPHNPENQGPAYPCLRWLAREAFALRCGVRWQGKDGPRHFQCKKCPFDGAENENSRRLLTRSPRRQGRVASQEPHGRAPRPFVG